jgi:trehalose-6-phosphate synthase
VVKQKVNLESRNVVIAAFNLPVKIKKVQEKWEITWKNSRDFIRNFHNDTSKMKVKFVGFPGIFPSPAEREELEELLLQYDCYPVWIEEDLYEKFFSGFCKEILWPLFHYFTPSLKAGFAKRWDMLWQAYNSVNMSVRVLEIF